MQASTSSSSISSSPPDPFFKYQNLPYENPEKHLIEFPRSYAHVQLSIPNQDESTQTRNSNEVLKWLSANKPMADEKGKYGLSLAGLAVVVNNLYFFARLIESHKVRVFERDDFGHTVWELMEQRNRFLDTFNNAIKKIFTSPAFLDLKKEKVHSLLLLSNGPEFNEKIFKLMSETDVPERATTSQLSMLEIIVLTNNISFQNIDRLFHKLFCRNPVHGFSPFELAYFGAKCPNSYGIKEPFIYNNFVEFMNVRHIKPPETETEYDVYLQTIVTNFEYWGKVVAKQANHMRLVKRKAGEDASQSNLQFSSSLTVSSSTQLAEQSTSSSVQTQISADSSSVAQPENGSSVPQLGDGSSVAQQSIGTSFQPRSHNHQTQLGEFSSVDFRQLPTYPQEESEEKNQI